MPVHGRFPLILRAGPEESEPERPIAIEATVSTLAVSPFTPCQRPQANHLGHRRRHGRVGFYRRQNDDQESGYLDKTEEGKNVTGAVEK